MRAEAWRLVVGYATVLCFSSFLLFFYHMHVCRIVTQHAIFS